MVKWVEINAGELKDRISCVKVKASELIDKVGQTEDLNIRHQTGEGLEVDFNLRRLLAPLGEVARIFYNNEDYDAIKDVVTKYWRYKGEPVIHFDVIKISTDKGEDFVTLRNKFVYKEKVTNRLQDFLIKVDLSIVRDNYQRLVVGGDGKNIELQFLDTKRRAEVKVGDFVDPGIFITINGSVKCSPGVNVLRCTNGMVERLNLWEGSDYSFLSDVDMMRRGTRLIQWLVTKSEKKVGSIREISISLGDTYKKGLLGKFWKSWAEKIDLNELTWYDVIQDLTQSVNNTLSVSRYRVLEISNRITKFEEDHRCYTCSAKV